MIKKTRLLLLPLVSLLVSSSISPAVLPEAASREAIYDVYFRGVQTVELTVGPVEDESTAFTIRRKNWRTNQWGTSTSATGDKAADDERFELPGALEKLPAHITEIGLIDWNAHRVVAWPDSTSLYVRNRVIESKISRASMTISRPTSHAPRRSQVNSPRSSALSTIYIWSHTARLSRPSSLASRRRTSRWLRSKR